MIPTAYKKYLAQLCEYLAASAVAYQQYLAGGKTFRYAKELKKYNGQISSLLADAPRYLAISQQEDAAALLHHYSVWTSKWEQLAEAMNPGPDDEFVFANEVTFPRQAARNLEAEYSRVKNA